MTNSAFPFLFSGLILTGLILGGCGNDPPVVEAARSGATPTLHHVFSSSNSDNEEVTNDVANSLVTPESRFDQFEFETREAPARQATITPLPTLTPRPTIATRIVPIYDDQLVAGWSLESSEEMVYAVDEDVFTHSGSHAIAFTPQVAESRLIFALLPDAEQTFLRDEVTIVRFWLYSGEDYIDPQDLLVSVVGSNAYPYWVADDDSVQVDDSRPLFPNSRLFFLDIKDVIPPDTWVPVEVWLDELLYEPNYKYVNGLIITNDELFMRTAYIDDVEIVVKE